MPAPATPDDPLATARQAAVSPSYVAHSPGPTSRQISLENAPSHGGRGASSPTQKRRAADAPAMRVLGLGEDVVVPAAAPPRQTAPFMDAVKETQQNFKSDIKAKQYEKPLLTVDVVVFTVLDGELRVLLLQRKSEPHVNMWSIPGGFMHLGETLDEAVNRRLLDRTGVKEIYLEQLATFGEPRRDPRARVITVAYIALVAAHRLQGDVQANEETRWFKVQDMPKLAFDHRVIVDAAIQRLRERLETSTIAYQLLPEEFTLTELQRIYETISGKKLDKRNFRKKILATDDVVELEGRTKMEGFHRPAQLYTTKQM
jgi:8-oxo-dGTP diphosphatase